MGNHPRQGTDNQRHGDGRDQRQLGSGRSIWSGMAVRPSVFVVDIGEGFQGWWGGLSGGRGEAL
ncbi:MAG: hypothetical protein ACRDSF_12250 [Pseudonocardiaceae bacterium]